MKKWAELGADDMFPYVCIPTHPKKSDSVVGRHILAFRNVVKSCLPGSLKLKNGFIALHHFPYEFREYVKKKYGMQLSKWIIPHEIGKHYGLGEDTICSFSHEVEKSYYCAPIQSIEESLQELYQAMQCTNIFQHQMASEETVWCCDVCLKQFRTYNEAAACEAACQHQDRPQAASEMRFQCPKCLRLCQDAAALDRHEAECSVSTPKNLPAQDSAGGAEVIDLESDDDGGKQGDGDKFDQPAVSAEDPVPAAEEGETEEKEWQTVWTVSEV